MNAIYHFKNDSLQKAKELIDAASVDTIFSDKAATWYYRGFIYKGLFKKNEAADKQSNYRLQSINYFKKSLEIEPEGTYAAGSKNSLKYFAQTIFNHSASSLNPDEYPVAISNYRLYKDLMLEYDSTLDLTEKDIMFNLALAMTYSRIAENDSSKSEMYTEQAKQKYTEVLKMDSNNISANYNLGIIYYNEGVEIVNNMDYSLDLFELNAVQDQIIELFRTSLPYMKKAYDLNPKRKETLIGLQGIYFSLNDIPKSEAFKKELEGLSENGAEKSPEEDSPMIENEPKEED